jgi:hypothetical protein
MTGDTCFQRYWEADEFFQKRAVMNGSLEQRFGDNIYHRNSSNEWVQEDSRHSYDEQANERNRKRDTETTTRVLLSNDFVYWGEDAPQLPPSLSAFAIGRIGYECRYAEEDVSRLVDWAMGKGQRGLIGDPLEWRYERWWR